MSKPNAHLDQRLSILFGFQNCRRPLSPRSGLAGAADHVLASENDVDADLSLSFSKFYQQTMPHEGRDSITIATPFTPGEVAEVGVWAISTGFLNTWIDFSGRGTFESADQITMDWPLQAGSNNMLVDIPDKIGNAIRCRFQFSSTPIGRPSSPNNLQENVETIDIDLGAISDVVPHADSQAFSRDPSTVVYLLDGQGDHVLNIDRQPLFTTPGDDGEYTFYGLPDGEYQCVIGVAIEKRQHPQHAQRRTGQMYSTRTDGPEVYASSPRPVFRPTIR